MSLKRRIYVQFLVAILPLALIVLYQAVSRDDLPQRVNAALKAYDSSLQASDAFKEFLTGVGDAIDSGRLGSVAVAALQRASASQASLAATSEADRPLAERLERLLATVSANASIDAILPLKNEVQALRAALLESTDARRKALTALVEEGEASARRRQEILVAAGFGALLLLAFMAYVLRRLVLGITRPLAASAAVANAIADGRLDNPIEVRGGDEIGQLQAAIRAMQEHLSRVVLAVRAGAESVAMASTALSSETRDLSHRSEEQAASLEQAAASMEELATTVKANSASAKQADSLAKSASQGALAGSAAVKRVVDTMQQIASSSRKIEDIVAVIDSIAFQTNILALNAAVEAARAGEQGRGFAVVAGEVRSLAQRATTAAAEIRTLIKTSVADVESGGRQVTAAGASIDELVTGVQHVTSLMSEIAAASHQQERGIEQVSETVTQMDSTVQHNAVAVQRNAAASEKLQRDAQALAEAVSRFTLAGAAASPASTEGQVSRLPLDARNPRANRREPLKIESAAGRIARLRK